MLFKNNRFISKPLSQNKYRNKYRTEDNWANYKKQRNFCVNLLRKTKTEYFEKLNVKYLTKNRKFWKTIKAFFSNKGLTSNKLMLKENNRIITEEKELATPMHTLFINITKSLDIKKDNNSSSNPINSENISDILEKHKPYPSVHETSQNFMTNEKFSFKFVREDQVREEIKNLDGFKATPTGDISVDVLKSTVDIHLPFITNSINLPIVTGCFLKKLKLAKVSPIFKKKDDLDKENNWPVTILPHESLKQ